MTQLIVTALVALTLAAAVWFALSVFALPTLGGM